MATLGTRATLGTMVNPRHNHTFDHCFLCTMQALNEALIKAFPEFDPSAYPWPDADLGLQMGTGWVAAPEAKSIDLKVCVLVRMWVDVGVCAGSYVGGCGCVGVGVGMGVRVCLDGRGNACRCGSGYGCGWVWVWVWEWCVCVGAVEMVVGQGGVSQIE
jgi:hypothetical protein